MNTKNVEMVPAPAAVDDNMDAIDAPKSIGDNQFRYHIICMLGEGTQCQVFRAIDQQNGQHVAFKGQKVQNEKMNECF